MMIMMMMSMEYCGYGLRFPHFALLCELAVLSWQLRWNRSTTGRSTHELIPNVDTKMVFPKNRCVSVSYVRLLLNDTTLKDHQHRLGLSVTKVCDCDQGIEDDYHFLFECCRYKEIRKQLIRVRRAEYLVRSRTYWFTDMVCRTSSDAFMPGYFH